MSTARRDRSGVFDADLKRRRMSKAAVLDKIFHLSPRGITFVTDTCFPEWTEVGVEMHLPARSARNDQPRQIGCRGVVVQCVRRDHGPGFEVALLFLDLPKNAQNRLVSTPPAVCPLSIAIAR